MIFRDLVGIKMTVYKYIKDNENVSFRQCDVAVTCDTREQLDLFFVRIS